MWKQWQTLKLQNSKDWIFHVLANPNSRTNFKIIYQMYGNASGWCVNIIPNRVNNVIDKDRARFSRRLLIEFRSCTLFLCQWHVHMSVFCFFPLFSTYAHCHCVYCCCLHYNIFILPVAGPLACVANWWSHLDIGVALISNRFTYLQAITKPNVKMICMCAWSARDHIYVIVKRTWQFTGISRTPHTKLM